MSYLLNPNLVLAGDMVCTGANSTPVFRVIAVVGDKTWLREENSGSDYIIPVERCRVTGSAGDH